MSDKNYGEIVLPITVGVEDFWSNVLGSGWEDSSWWQKWKYSAGADWQTPGVITIWAEDPEDEDKTIKAELNVQDLANGYALAVKNGFHHCGYSLDWENLDYCGSDGILQFAIYGKLIFG
jgi:hypothetical protein